MAKFKKGDKVKLIERNTKSGPLPAGGIVVGGPIPMRLGVKHHLYESHGEKDYYEVQFKGWAHLCRIAVDNLQ